MTLFRSVGGDITLFDNDARAIYFVLVDAEGVAQDLSGHSFTFVGRVSGASSPIVTIAMIVAGDERSVVAPVDMASAALLGAAAVHDVVVYDVVDTTAGANTTRWTGRIAFISSAALEPSAAPLWIDLPYAEVVASTESVAVSERGPQGVAAARQMFAAGFIDAPTVEAMNAYLTAQGASGAAEFADAAEAKAAEAAGAAEGALAARVQAENAADRADLAQESVQVGAAAYDNFGVGLAATAEGALFRVFANDGTIKTFRKVGGAGVEKIAVEGAALATARRAQVAAKADGYPRGAPPMVVDGKLVLRQVENGDGSATALETIDLVTGRRWAAGEPAQSDGPVTGGRAALLRGLNGGSVLDYDLIEGQLVSPFGQFRGLSEEPDAGFGRTVERDEAGKRMAAYEPGQFVRFVPRRLDGLTIQADHNKIPQLWQVIEGPNGSAIDRRQLTYSQWGVTDYQVVSVPEGSTPGLIRIFCNDQDLLSQRHIVRYALWHDGRAVMVDPTGIVYFVLLGQSNSVGAGSFDNNPTEVAGPQTIRTAMPIRYQSFAKSRLLTWNGGTIPHQGNLNGLASDATYGTAQFVPIDPARITSLVPMREGLGEAGAHAEGGWRRESLCSSLALHLNGPTGWDGSRYVAAASFGFGSSTFANLFYDAGTRKNSWINALASITRMKALADAAGLPLEVHVLCDHGESAQSDTTYQDRWETFLPVMQADIVAITGQAGAPQLFLAQTIAARGTFAEPAYSSLAQVRLAAAHADIHLLPPFYWADFEVDVVHYKPTETQLRGALYGEVINDWFQRGQDAALTIGSATWSGSQISVNFSHPVTCDTETVVLSVAGNGITHINTAGTTRSIASARIDAADARRVLIRTSSDIPSDAAEKVRNAYGNQTTPSAQTMGWGGAPTGGGQRSCWRRADWQRFSLIDGRPLHIFANIQELDATKEA